MEYVIQFILFFIIIFLYYYFIATKRFKAKYSDKEKVNLPEVKLLVRMANLDMKKVNYKKLLKQVAINYAEKVDKQGFFNVNPSDETSVIFRKFGNKESLSFNTQDLLDFSGLLTTTSKYPHRYRFHPLWLHHYLLNLKD